MARRVSLLLWFCAALAAADDLRTPGEQVIEELTAALDAGDNERAVRLLGEIGGLYRYPASREEADSLVKLAGRATGSTNRPVVLAALRALGDAGAADGAVHLKRFLQSAESELMVAAIRTAGRIRADTLVPRLRELARKSPDLTVADQSLVALSEFFRSPPALRRKVAEGVLAECQAISRNGARWRRLRAPGLRALQRLMGRRLNSVSQFADWWRVAKTRKDPFSR